MENEFGFVGPNEPYLRHITATARANLGSEVVLYSTDPPSVITKGTLGAKDGILACGNPSPLEPVLRTRSSCPC